MANRLNRPQPDTPLQQNQRKEEARHARRLSVYWIAAFALNALALFLLSIDRNLMLAGISVCFFLIAWMLSTLDHITSGMVVMCAVFCVVFTFLMTVASVLLVYWPILVLVAAECAVVITLRKKF